MAKTRSRTRARTARPRTPAARRREPSKTSAQRIQRTLDAVPDRIDIRDWVYRPHLSMLPDQLINCDSVPEVLDQGREGACTGFALAAVINYHLGRRNLRRIVSPRMLYEMARRYDEWPGERYEGSSARGAVKGWVAHGVCTRQQWPDEKHGLRHFAPQLSQAARRTPGGAYYRVAHREIRDMHAALAESGILYATLMVHEGWGEPGAPDNLVREIRYVENGNLRTRQFPVIQRKGRADSGHAVAIVGYTGEGFIIQNSWGTQWGVDGFALLPYTDFLMHTTDVWVVQAGVPVDLDLWLEGKAADTTAGVQRASQAVPLADIRPFVVDVANNGELSRSGHYWTTEADLQRLFAEEIPKRTRGWSKARILLYLHGGLNDEEAAARRIVSFRDVLLENEIYPLHIMWETGVMESLRGMLADLFTDEDERAGVADWLDRFRKGLAEARDRSLELTVSRFGTKLWDEMKENAALASDHPDDEGGMQLLAKYAQQAVAALSAEQRKRFELHVVAHSAGSKFAAHALPLLQRCGIPLVSLHLMAPAIAASEFKKMVLPDINSGKCPHPSLYILSDAAERDDSIGPYGKSLLYLVSNAFEGRRATPLLGMECFVSGERSVIADPTLAALFKKKVNGLPSLIVAHSDPNAPRTLSPSRSQSKTHGGFDNDPATMNSILWRILGKKPQRVFLDRDLKFE